MARGLCCEPPLGLVREMAQAYVSAAFGVGGMVGGKVSAVYLFIAVGLSGCGSGDYVALCSI